VAFTGTYSDGRTAAQHQVSVTSGPLGLVISGPTIRPMTWPLSDVKVLPSDERTAPLRITRRSDNEPRLVVADPQFRAALFRQTPALDPQHGRVRRTFALTAGSLATAAVLGAALWFGLPLVAKPVADLIPHSVEARLGERIFTALIGKKDVCEDPDGQDALDVLVQRVLAGVEEPVDIVVEVVDSPIVNAVALPGGHIVIFSGLLNKVESADEVSGVLAHEIGHIIHRHSMQALVRHLAVTMVVTVFTGNDWGLGSAAQLLLQNAYSREAEAEADATGVAALDRAGLRAGGLATFFTRLEKEHGDGELMRYVGTHPPLADRRSATARDGKGEPVLSDAEWAALKAICKKD
jgi:Zn-dependent protease with chaperone function